MVTETGTLEALVLADHLAAAVGAAAHVAPKSTTLPICREVLLETVAGRLRLTATDLDMALAIYIGAQVEQEGAATIPAHVGAKLLRALEGQATITASGSKLTVAVNGRRVELAGSRPEDFPPTPDAGPTICELDPAELRRALDRVLFATSGDDRPILSAVHFAPEEGGVTLAGADGFCLSECRIECRIAVKGWPAIWVNIPATSLAELRRLIAKSEEPIGVALPAGPKAGSCYVRFSGRRPVDFELTTALRQGSFPNYSSLWPDPTLTIRADVAALMAEVKAAYEIAKGGDTDPTRRTGGIVRFQLKRSEGGPKLTISARAEEHGEFSSVLAVAVDGYIDAAGGERWALSGQKTLDVLGSLKPAEHVAIGVSRSDRPVLFTPEGDRSYRHMLMPMTVQWAAAA